MSAPSDPQSEEGREKYSRGALDNPSSLWSVKLGNPPLTKEESSTHPVASTCKIVARRNTVQCAASCPLQLPKPLPRHEKGGTEFFRRRNIGENILEATKSKSPNVSAPRNHQGRMHVQGVRQSQGAGSPGRDVGCLTNDLRFKLLDDSGQSCCPLGQANLSSWLLLLVQMLCSVLAGVYNEAPRDLLMT